MDRKRVRQARGLDNDRRILDASVTTVTDRGVDGFGLRDVAAAAGLTYGALYARYANTGELLADTWAQRLLPELERLSAAAIAAAGAAGSPGAGHLLGVLVGPTPLRQALVEVLVVTPRVGELADVVPSAVQALLERMGLLPASGVEAGSSAATRAVAAPATLGALVLALGSVAHANLDPSLEEHAGRVSRWMAEAQRRSWTGPAPVPVVPVPVVLALRDDDRRGRLMDAAVRVVAHSGVAGASLRRIYRASGYTQAAVYTEYGNLRGLIADLVDRATAGVTAVDPTPGRYTRPELLAARLAGLASPEGQLRRRLALELFLLASHEPDIGLRTAAADAAADAAVAAHLLPANPDAAAVQAVFRRVGRHVMFGSAVLSGVVPGLAGLDWRPFIGGMLGAVLAEQGIPEGR